MNARQRHTIALSGLIFGSLLLSSPHALAQPKYVGRFDAFTGFTDLYSPAIDLREPGFQLQVGVRPGKWYSIGFDYSVSKGDLSLTADKLLPSVQQQLGAQLGRLAAAGQLPPGYQLVVPTSSTTHTFALGPQLAIRKWAHITPFIRPDFGAIHEVATPHPRDPIATAIVQQLEPSGKKTDWVPFYGFGGGVDFWFTKYLGLRVQADFVHDYLFNDLLRSSRNTGRFSIGPTFQWGHNIMQ